MFHLWHFGGLLIMLYTSTWMSIELITVEIISVAIFPGSAAKWLDVIAEWQHWTWRYRNQKTTADII